MNRALLANPGLAGQPMRGTYYFVGDARDDNRDRYTVHPFDDSTHLRTEETNSLGRVLAEMQDAHVNTVVLSHWGPTDSDRWRFWAPMWSSFDAEDHLFDAAVLWGMTVMPAIESGDCTQGVGGSSWSFHFQSEFPLFVGDWRNHPVAPDLGNVSPPLVHIVVDLVRHYLQDADHPERRNAWTQMYDREGRPRFVMNLLHVASNQLAADRDDWFAAGFDLVADRVAKETGEHIGFTLDLIPSVRELHGFPSESNQNCGSWEERERPENTKNIWKDNFTASATTTGPLFRRSNAVIAIQSFVPEIRAPLWAGQLPGGDARPAPLEQQLRDYKGAFLDGWVNSGVPVILDVSPGYDGHLAFAKAPHIWGYSDSWRNFQSERKGRFITGIVYNTWNGYTEGYAGMPLRGANGERDDRGYRWLEALFRFDPRECHHIDSIGGHPGSEVYGAICEKWVEFGGSFGFLGRPLTSELDGCVAGSRISWFAGGAIYWSGGTGAHELHGEIYAAWEREGGSCSRLGLPTADETDGFGGRVSTFQNGRIVWTAGGGTAVTYF